jgi:hypothetical protein
MAAAAARELEPGALPSLLEYTLAALALGSLLAVHIVSQDGAVLFTRPLWLDEVHTILVTQSDTPAEMIRHIGAGAEHNPPAMHFLLWLIGAITSGLSPTILRGYAFVTVWATAGLVYVLLRRHFERLPAFAGALLVVSHPLLLRHTFDGRMYALFLLATCAFAYAVHCTARSGRWRQIWLIASAAVLLCLTHYYGIFVWLLLLLPAAVSGSREARKRLLPALLGPGALAACTPLYWGQRQAIGGRTWVEPVSATQIAEVVLELLPPPVVLVTLATFVAIGLVTMKTRRTATIVKLGGGVSGALLSLALLPVLLLLVSVLVQPTMVARYALPAALAMTPVVAIAVSKMGRPLGIGFILVLALTGHLSIGAKIAHAQTYLSAIGHDAELLRRGHGTAPVVTVSRHIHYRTVFGDSLLERTVIYVIMPDSLIEARNLPHPLTATERATMQVERDVALVQSTRFGFPRTIAIEELRKQDSIVLAGTASSEVLSFAENWLPEYELRRLSIRIYLAVRVRAPEVVSDQWSAH